MEKIKISPMMALAMVIGAISTDNHLLYFSIVFFHAGRDSWLSLAAVAVPVVLLGYVVGALAKRHSGKTVVEFTRDILGRWVGTVVAILLIFFFFLNNFLSMQGFAEFFTSSITPRTPTIFYMITLTALVVYSLRCGLEVTARSALILLTLTLIAGILATLLTTKEKEFANLLPIMEFGAKPMLRGSFVLLALFGKIFVITMIFPFTDGIKNFPKYTMLTAFFLVIISVGPIIGPIAIFGVDTAIKLYFPTYQELRDINIGELPRLDMLGVILWCMGTYIKISLFHFATVLGLAQLLKIDDYKVLLIPAGALLIVMSITTSANFMELSNHLRYIQPFITFFFVVFIPILLLMVDWIRSTSRLKKSMAD